MIPRSLQYRVYIGTGYTEGNVEYFRYAEVGWVCWMKRGPTGKDDTLGEMVTMVKGFQFGAANTGRKGRFFE